MTKAMTKRERRDREIMLDTFAAISSAMGWDKTTPEPELHLAVIRRMAGADRDAIRRADEQLADKLGERE